ncbi:LysR family transcriptional regulator [Amorphus sp. 3PC139-8]
MADCSKENLIRLEFRGDMSDLIRSLRTVNLNLLPIFAELLRCRNVTRAAERLNLTQSTVSGALRQLRDIFQDEILVQRGREMHLTEKARRLHPEVERLIELSSRLFQKEYFDPLTAQTNFHVATADYVSALMASRIARVLSREAPNVSLTLAPTPGSSIAGLRLGTLDLIICPNRRSNLEACGLDEGDTDFGCETFMHEEWVAIQWAEHSSVANEVTREEYFSRPHAIYCRTDGRNTIEQDTLEEMGIHQTNQFFVPYFTLLPQMVVGTNLISVIPKTMADQYAKQYPVAIFPLPYDLPGFDIAMIWIRNREANADLAWLRSVIRRTASTCEDDIGAETPET